DVFGTGAKSAIIIPRDGTSFRPAGVNGMIRYNTNINRFEAYENNNWLTMTPTGNGDNLGNHIATTAILAVAGTGSAPGYSFSVSGGGMGMSAAGTANLAFSTANTERMRIDSSGNVGIGTSAPRHQLQINASTTLIGTTISTSNANSSGNAGSSYSAFQG